MFGEHHDLENEFPEYKEQILMLKENNPRFAELYEEYQAVEGEVYKIMEQEETPSDAYTEDLKKRRVHLKDELYAILRAQIG